MNQSDIPFEPIRLFDSEIRLMELLWECGPIKAKALSLLAAERIGWNKNTTYTILTKLVDKGAVTRDEPGFLCTPAITRLQVQRGETASLIGKLFQGSRRAFLSAFLDGEALSAEEIDVLKVRIAHAEGQVAPVAQLAEQQVVQQVEQRAVSAGTNGTAVELKAAHTKVLAPKGRR